MMLNTDIAGPVFKPWFEFQSGRSLLPEDIPAESFEPLFVFASSLDEPILRARVMDVLWVRRIPNKKLDAAKEAISSYLKCVNSLDLEPAESIPYLKRALNITYELGKAGKDLRGNVYAIFEQTIQQYSSDELNDFHRELFLTMAERKIGDQEKLYELMLDAAAAHELKSSFLLMRAFLELAKKFAKNAQRPENEILGIRVREAESYVQEAGSRGEAMVQAHFLEQAIQAYRSIGGYENRVKELHEEMLDVQKHIPEFLYEFSVPLPDMSEVVGEARKAVLGKAPLEALITLAFITNLVDPEEERSFAIEQVQKYPLQYMVVRSMIGKNGKTISQSARLDVQAITGDEPAVYSAMLQNFHLNIHLELYSKILPALRTTLEEHEISDLLLLDIIRNNQLVPYGREIFFLRGIKAGFEYDFATASLYLIPQLENSIRVIMEQKGIIASKLTPTGIQREKDLNDLFDEEVVKNLFGEKYIFTLKALLTEQEGANLRNKLAHGLAEYDELQGDASAYFWWLTLRLLLMPLMSQQGTDADKKG